MGKNKTALIILVSVIALSVLLYFLPINRLIGTLPLINRFYNNTTVEILTKRGKAKIWIEGKDYGETPATIENLPEGTYLVELERIEEEDSSFYKRQSLQIELTRNTSARIDLEIGPDNLLHGIILYYTPVRTSSQEGDSSFYKRQSLQIELTRNTSARIDLEIGPDNLLHGIILYYTPVRTSSQEGFLTVISNVDGGRVFLDGEFLKVSPITNLALKENQYNVKVTATGYEDVEVPILIRDNYALNLKTFHFPIPIRFDSLEAGESTKESTDDLTEGAVENE